MKVMVYWNLELERNDGDMSAGREHDERRKAQAAAARRHRNRSREASNPGKGNRSDWTKEL